mmetsp:Transcript_18080/g.23790  ORF Transcript_18080/g.23790 Transcript_18080/m.23790 type:complete len:126 (-) Transcript_18080:201-578(-)
MLGGQESGIEVTKKEKKTRGSKRKGNREAEMTKEKEKVEDKMTGQNEGLPPKQQAKKLKIVIQNEKYVSITLESVQQNKDQKLGMLQNGAKSGSTSWGQSKGESVNKCYGNDIQENVSKSGSTIW